MGGHHLSEDQAFDVLRRYSQENSSCAKSHGRSARRAACPVLEIGTEVRRATSKAMPWSGGHGSDVGTSACTATSDLRAVPVQTDDGGVVGEVPVARIGDCGDQGAYDLARVGGGRVMDKTAQVDRFRLSFLHAVGIQDQAVAGP